MSIVANSFGGFADRKTCFEMVWTWQWIGSDI